MQSITATIKDTNSSNYYMIELDTPPKNKQMYVHITSGDNSISMPLEVFKRLEHAVNHMPAMFSHDEQLKSSSNHEIDVWVCNYSIKEDNYDNV